MGTLVVGNISDGTNSILSTYVTSGVATAMALYNQETPSLIIGKNVSSVTDNAAGTFTVNFTNAYSAAQQRGAGGSDGQNNFVTYETRATGSVSHENRDINNNLQDQTVGPIYLGFLA